MKSNSFVWPILVGLGSILLFAYLDRKEEDNEVCSSVSAAVLASNPNLERSYEIERAKNRCIEERICRPDVWFGGGACEFTAYDLRECRDIDPVLADYKTARRHLEAEVKTCELTKVVNPDGVTVYQWIHWQ